MLVSLEILGRDQPLNSMWKSGTLWILIYDVVRLQVRYCKQNMSTTLGIIGHRTFVFLL